MNNNIIIVFIILIIAGLGFVVGQARVLESLKHCEKIAENMPFESIEECVMELTR